MSAEAAARMGDEIAHGFGLAAMIAGAVAGAVIGAAVVAATAATGGLAAVIIAGAIAGGGLAAGQIMSGLTTIFNLPEPTSGVVATGSFNVLTNLRPAVRALLDVAACSGIPMNHPPLPMPVPLVEGSATVLINSMPASRLKSKLMCGAHMKSGSNNVVIGGETARVGFCFDLESWFKTGLEWLGMGALIGGALFAIAAGAAAVAGFVAITGGGMALFEGLGRIGDALGPGYRDLLQGVAGMGLLVASPKIAKLGAPKAAPEVVETPPVSSIVAKGPSVAVSAETIAARQATARSFYEAAGWPERRIANHLAGIDYTQPVDVITLPPNEPVVQHLAPDGPVGNYFAPVGTQATELGINPAGRVPTPFATTAETPVLRSTAAPILDTWTVPETPFQASGGGTQYFTPDPSSFRRIP